MMRTEDIPEAEAKRERSLPRLLEDLVKIKHQTMKLMVHAKAACYIIGIPVGIETKESPKPGTETAPMVMAFNEIAEISCWLSEIDASLGRALSELAPDFYDTLKTKRDRP